MIRENTRCPQCDARTDLYRGQDERYLCLHCWIEKRGTIIPARGNGKSHGDYTKMKRRLFV